VFAYQYRIGGRSANGRFASTALSRKGGRYDLPVGCAHPQSEYPRFRFGHRRAGFDLCAASGPCRCSVWKAAETKRSLCTSPRRPAAWQPRSPFSGFDRGSVRVFDGALGDPSRPKLPGGHDTVVGQNNAPGQKRERRCVIFGSGVEQASVGTDAQWIMPTGGCYFFVPSIAALRDVIGGGV
jgi:hypothetical protein